MSQCSSKSLNGGGSSTTPSRSSLEDNCNEEEQKYSTTYNEEEFVDPKYKHKPFKNNPPTFTHNHGNHHAEWCPPQLSISMAGNQEMEVRMARNREMEAAALRLAAAKRTMESVKHLAEGATRELVEAEMFLRETEMRLEANSITNGDEAETFSQGDIGRAKKRKISLSSAPTPTQHKNSQVGGSYTISGNAHDNSKRSSSSSSSTYTLHARGPLDFNSNDLVKVETYDEAKGNRNDNTFFTKLAERVAEKFASHNNSVVPSIRNDLRNVSGITPTVNVSDSQVLFNGKGVCPPKEPMEQQQIFFEEAFIEHRDATLNILKESAARGEASIPSEIMVQSRADYLASMGAVSRGVLLRDHMAKAEAEAMGLLMKERESNKASASLIQKK